MHVRMFNILSYNQLYTYTSMCNFWKFMLQVDIEQFDVWLFPVNIDDSHWILLV